MKTNNRMGVWVSLVALLAGMVACGGSARVTPAMEVSRCVPASSQQMEAIRAGVQGVQTSNDVRYGWAVSSRDFKRAWFVAAKIYGPGMENGTGPGVWVMAGEQNAPAGIYSVNGFAREFSDWGDGSGTDAGFSMSDDGAAEAQACAR